jgi:putative starch synthase
MDLDGFERGSVPVIVAARVYGKDAAWVRAGIIAGWLPIGTATRNGEKITTIDQMNSKYGRINFYISPKKLYEETGYIWKGERE